MNFKLSLILIVLISIAIPSTVFLLQEPSLPDEVNQSEKSNKSFLYTAPEDQIISIDFIGANNKIRFEKFNDSWSIIEGDRTFPVNPARWSGITYLLKGPLIQRTLDGGNSENLDQFGLKNPSFKVKLEFNGIDPIVIEFGILSSDQSYQFVKLENQQFVHTLNASYGNALENLLKNPPRPTWIYDFEKENINEILIYHSGILYKALGRDIFTKDGGPKGPWKICDILIDDLTGNPYIEKEPCDGEEVARLDYPNSILDHMKNPQIDSVVVTGLETEKEFLEYGIDNNSTYIYLRNNTFTENGTLLIKPITVSLSNIKPKYNQEGQTNAVFQDSKDVVLVSESWVDDIVKLMFCTTPHEDKPYLQEEELSGECPAFDY